MLSEGSAEPQAGGWLIVALNEQYLGQQLMPLLARRYFHVDDGGHYHLRIRGAFGKQRVVYDSAPQHVFPAHAERTADLASRAWQLDVTREGGPAESSIEWSRVTGFVLSTVSFLILAAALIALFLSTRRAQDLARAQCEFVSGVSHELLTPLAALRSIGDNLCDGLVGQQKIHRYGQLIKMQVQRLSELVEDALEFVRSPQRHPLVTEERTDPAKAIEDALTAYATTSEIRRFQIVKDIAPGLPPVRCPSALLRRSLQNLIGNALKYGAEGRWIRIGARSTESGEVIISVEDNGCGVRPDEKGKSSSHSSEDAMRAPPRSQVSVWD
jgi:signal transduction histidine kinase